MSFLFFVTLSALYIYVYSGLLTKTKFNFMKEHIKPFLIAFVAVIVALVVYNMFIANSGLFSFEGSNNYDVDDSGNILRDGQMHIAA